MTKWLVMIALLAGCATQQKAQSDCKPEWAGRPPVQVDSCTGRSEEVMAGWHWYDYVFGIQLGMVGFYDPGRTADERRGVSPRAMRGCGEDFHAHVAEALEITR